MILEYFIPIILGYLLGSINSSIIVSKFIYRKDIRNFGSGNAGLTNTLRAFGTTAAILVLSGDILKGVFAVLIGNQISGHLGMLLAGAFSIFGHNWPVYFNFKGGKGILTSAAVLFMLDWKIGLILLIIAIIIMAITRFVSLASITAAVLFPVLVYYLDSYRGIDKNSFLVFSIVIAVLAVFRHRSNIGRLIKGNERKLGQKVNVN